MEYKKITHRTKNLRYKKFAPLCLIPTVYQMHLKSFVFGLIKVKNDFSDIKNLQQVKKGQFFNLIQQ